MTAKDWFVKNDVKTTEEAFQLIINAKLLFPDFAIALKYVRKLTI